MGIRKMAIQKKSLVGAAASKLEATDRPSDSKPKAKPEQPTKPAAAKKLTVAKLATAKLSTAKLLAIRRIT
jgi:hypothetical protein